MKKLALRIAGQLRATAHVSLKIGRLVERTPHICGTPHDVAFRRAVSDWNSKPQLAQVGKGRREQN